MPHVAFVNLLNKLIQLTGDPPLNYEILTEQRINNEYLFHVNLQYKNYIILSTAKIKILINESEKTDRNDQPNFISKNCKKLNEIRTQNNFAFLKNTVLRIKTSLEDSTSIAICFIKGVF